MFLVYSNANGLRERERGGEAGGQQGRGKDTVVCAFWNKGKILEHKMNMYKEEKDKWKVNMIWTVIGDGTKVLYFSW